MLAGRMLRRSAARFPDKDAILWQGTAMSYAAFDVAAIPAVVPPGLAGTVVGHIAFGIDASGKIVASNEEFLFHQ